MCRHSRGIYRDPRYLGHVPVGLRAYSYLFWLTDNNAKVYGLHALMFITWAAANHRIASWSLAPESLFSPRHDCHHVLQDT